MTKAPTVYDMFEGPNSPLAKTYREATKTPQPMPTQSTREKPAPEQTKKFGVLCPNCNDYLEDLFCFGCNKRYKVSIKTDSDIVTEMLNSKEFRPFVDLTPTPELFSQCHHAPMRVVGKTTLHYECAWCGNPCNPESMPSETPPTPPTSTQAEAWEVEFDKRFIHKGEDCDDSAEDWAWTIMGSYPIEVKQFIRQAQSQARAEGYKKATNDCWYTILDFPHNSDTGYMENLDLDDVFAKFEQLKKEALSTLTKERK